MIDYFQFGARKSRPLFLSLWMALSLSVATPAHADESAIESVAAGFATQLGENLVKEFLGKNPFTSAFSTMLFPEKEIDYEKIGRIVASEIGKANKDQTHLEVVMGDSAALMEQIGDALESLNFDKGTEEEEESFALFEEIRNKIVGQLEKIKVTSITTGSSPHVAFAKYLLLADRIIQADATIWNFRGQKKDPSEGAAALRKLSQDIAKFTKSSALLANKVVVRDLSADKHQPNRYPDGYTCYRTKETCGIGTINGGGGCTSDHIVRGPNSFFVSKGIHNCGGGFEPDFVRWGLVNQILGCEKMVNQALIAQCYSGSFINGGNKYFWMVGPSNWNSLMTYYFTPYRLTQSYQLKWATLLNCAEDPSSCTEDKWLNNIADSNSCNKPYQNQFACHLPEEMVNISMLLGEYSHDVSGLSDLTQNDRNWQKGSISNEGGELIWQNLAKKRWRLKIDFISGTLVTQSDNPYYKVGDPSRSEFRIRHKNGKVEGFMFLGNLYEKQ